MAPTECCAKRSVEHTPRIKHQALSSNRPCKSEEVEISLSRTLIPIATQSGVDWTEPGLGTWAYMDCITNYSEGGAGDDEMVPGSPLGGRTGGREKLQQLTTPTPSLALYSSPVLFPKGDVGAAVCLEIFAQFHPISFGWGLSPRQDRGLPTISSAKHSTTLLQ